MKKFSIIKKKFKIKQSTIYHPLLRKLVVVKIGSCQQSLSETFGLKTLSEYLDYGDMIWHKYLVLTNILGWVQGNSLH